MFITRYPLVVISRLIGRYIGIENYTKIKLKIRNNVRNSAQKTSLNNVKRNAIPISHQIKRAKNISLESSESYNELLQICVLYLSAYQYPYHLLSFLVKQTGLSNTTAWLRPKNRNNLRASTTSSSIPYIWLLAIFF